MAARQSETKAFYRLIWPHRAVILRTAQFLTHNPMDAEDLAQETLIKAFRNLASLRNEATVKAWLLSILRNTHTDRLRVRHDEVSLDACEFEPVSLGQMEEPVSQEELVRDPDVVLDSFSDEQMVRGLRRLPRDIRWTLILVDVEGLSLNEAGEILDVPTGTIKSRLNRGRAMLREKLTSSQVEPARN